MKTNHYPWRYRLLAEARRRGEWRDRQLVVSRRNGSSGNSAGSPGGNRLKIRRLPRHLIGISVLIAIAMIPEMSDGAAKDQTAREAVTIRVCPPRHPDPNCRFYVLQAAVAKSRPGDTIVLAPGIYTRGAVVNVDGITILGEKGAHLKQAATKKKAALVTTGKDIVVDGVECSRIYVPDRNGACIRAEGRNLTVRNVYFHDNEQGLLAGSATGDLLIEHSVFERNGKDGLAHGVYVGRHIERFTFRHNHVLSTINEGHGVKTRAKRSVIERNIIASLEGLGSRAIDVSNGGDVIIRENILEKGPFAKNKQMIGLSLEGEIHAVNNTRIERNLFVFDLQRSLLDRVVDGIKGRQSPNGRVLLSKSTGPVVLDGNVFVAAKEVGLDGFAAQNQKFHSRADAGLDPFPSLPDTVFDVEAIKTKD